MMMVVKIIFVILFVGSAVSRNVPRYTELDEDEQLLFRAAYDSPSYGNDEYNHYQVEEEVPLTKLDLLKDGMWAIKAKIKQMKAFNKALAANLLSTKLQVKEMLAEHLLALKKHHHVEIVKPVSYYQAPSKPPTYPQYQPPAPEYNSPAPQYGHPASQYGTHAPQYGSPAPQYGTQAPQYESPAPQYGTQAPQYGSPAPQYGTQAPQYGSPAPQYGPPQHTTPQYGPPPEHHHDPYYGH